MRGICFFLAVFLGVCVVYAQLTHAAAPVPDTAVTTGTHATITEQEGAP